MLIRATVLCSPPSGVRSRIGYTTSFTPTRSIATCRSSARRCTSGMPAPLGVESAQPGAGGTLAERGGRGEVVMRDYWRLAARSQSQRQSGKVNTPLAPPQYFGARAAPSLCHFATSTSPPRAPPRASPSATTPSPVPSANPAAPQPPSPAAPAAPADAATPRMPPQPPPTPASPAPPAGRQPPAP